MRVRALELRPQVRVASTDSLSPSLRLRTNRLGMYLTASSGSLRLIVSSICRAVVLKDFCGSWYFSTTGGVASTSFTAAGTCPCAVDDGAAGAAGGFRGRGAPHA